LFLSHRSLSLLNTQLTCIAAERFALAAGGRAGIRSESRKKPEARKMLENAAESHTSTARFVGQFFA